MSDVRCEPARKEKLCITNVCTCLAAFAAAGIMGALREMWGKKAEKCIWLVRNWNKQGDHKRVVRGGSRAKH